MAEALNVSLFTTDLYVPKYRTGDVGRWRIIQGGFNLDRGYHSGLWGVEGMPALLRRSTSGSQWETWMSLSPHELESQEFVCRHAAGNTVVMGLGMGWVALNLVLRKEVSHVTVIERDPEVIDLYHRSGAAEGVPADSLSKMKIIEADALAWRPESPVDFLYADIWQKIAEPATLPDVRRMQANIDARQVYFWGQEFVIYLEAQSLSSAEQKLTPASLRRCIAEKIRMPLLVPENIDYAAYIENVVALRRSRGLAVP